MGLSERLNRRYASAAAIILGIIWLWVAFDRPYAFPKHVLWNVSADAPQDPEVETVYNLFETSRVESDSLKNMCSATQWNDTVLFMCDHADGNAAQVRTSILMCVRYAIMTGADMVLPQIINGNGIHDAGLTTLDGNRQEFGFMFDTDHFLDSMQKSCPEMHIYKAREEVPFPNNYVRPPIITVYVDKLALRDGKDWRTTFYQLVDDMISPTEDTYPIIIEMARPSPTYQVYSDGIQLASDLGRLLIARADIRSLADKTISHLAHRYNLTLNASQPICNETFFGIHLLTREDSRGPSDGWVHVDWDFARYEPESKNYLDHAAQKGHRLVYVGSNRPDEVTRFTKDATALNLTVHSKFDLLDGEDKTALWKLSNDQMEMVDFLVLMKASDFAGTGHSSVSWGLAARRHLYAEGGTFSLGSHVFEDDLSQLYGRNFDNNSLFHHMWP
jgi:hypothetical protein